MLHESASFFLSLRTNSIVNLETQCLAHSGYCLQNCYSILFLFLLFFFFLSYFCPLLKEFYFLFPPLRHCEFGRGILSNANSTNAALRFWYFFSLQRPTQKNTYRIAQAFLSHTHKVHSFRPLKTV